MISWSASPAFVLLNILCLPSGLLAASSSSSSLYARTVVPFPIVVPASQLWDGNDGPWSSFVLSVGAPPQNVRVMVSTANNQPWVILPEGCFPTDPSNCADSRGGIFQPNSTSSWYVASSIKDNTTSGGIFSVTLDSNLGLSGDAQYAFSNVSLSNSLPALPSVASQLVGGIATKDYYMGLSGLNPAATSFSDTSTDYPSYLSNLKVQNSIPSLSYGYTAGAKYRFNGVFGSLTLGGYDSSLFIPNELSVAFSVLTSDLTIDVQSITMSSSNSANKSLSTTTFPAFIDSTVAQMYLPMDVCALFENAFGLTYNETNGLYLVDDALHNTLIAQNANVTFTLTNSTSKVLVDIVLPYQAFDLEVSWPLVDSSSRYFPLKRAANDSQTTLGRVFLQEAYLISDYERFTFSISQRKWDTASPIANIVSILPTSAAANAKSKEKINIGAIVAGAVGGFVLIIIMIIAVIMARRRHNKNKVDSDSQSSHGLNIPDASSMHMPSPYNRSIAPGSIISYKAAAAAASPTSVYMNMPAHPASPTSVYTRAARADSPTSVYTKTPVPPDSPTSMYHKEYNPTDTIYIPRRSPAPDGIPPVLLNRHTAFSSIHYEESVYEGDDEPMPASGNALLGGELGMSIHNASQWSLVSREPEQATPVAFQSISAASGKVQQEFVCELPAREQVGRDLLNFSKKPVWI